MSIVQSGVIGSEIGAIDTYNFAAHSVAATWSINRRKGCVKSVRGCVRVSKWVYIVTGLINKCNVGP